MKGPGAAMTKALKGIKANGRMEGARGFTGRAGAPESLESLESTGAIESLGSRAIKKNMQPRFLYPSPPCGAPLKKFRGALELV